MRVIYIANDGKEFDDEFECLDYEFAKEHCNLDSIELYDASGNRLFDAEVEETYYRAEKIIIHSESEIKDLHAVAEREGYLSYNDIDEVGAWIFNYDANRYVKAA